MKKRISRAIISVFDKTGVVELARGLSELEIEIISTGGTAKALREAGIDVVEVSELTGFPECLDGRVKTLHPAIHGGILAIRDNPEHMARITELGINLIDVCVINLYPFKQTISKENVEFSEAIENIDIGGPTMLRAAAKNYHDVIVLIDPCDYAAALEGLKRGCGISAEDRLRLAQKVFSHTANYDSMIASYLNRQVKLLMGSEKTSGMSGEGVENGTTDLEIDSVENGIAEMVTESVGNGIADIEADGEEESVGSLFETTGFDKLMTITFEKDFDMRYGENPHQTAALYKDPIPQSGTLTTAVKLHGKELSYNNINDADCALELLKEFDEPAVVAVKHATPCGVAIGEDVFHAYKAAHDSDAESIFGGIVAVNRIIDLKTAMEMSKIFLEIIIAPGFDPDAYDVLSKKKNIRLLKLDTDAARRIYLESQGVKSTGGLDENDFFIKKISGGLLVQGVNNITLDEAKLEIVTKKSPTIKEMDVLRFAMTVVKHAKSNAIVLAKEMGVKDVAANGMDTQEMNAKDMAAQEIAATEVGNVVLNQTTDNITADNITSENDGVHQIYRNIATVGIGSGQTSRIMATKAALDRAGDRTVGAVLASDAYFPFDDCAQAAAQRGITAIIQPGGSKNDQMTIDVCDKNNIAMVMTGTRHFKH